VLDLFSPHDGQPLLLDESRTVSVLDFGSRQMEVGLADKRLLDTGSSSESPTICRKADGARTSAVPFGAEDGRGAVLASSGPGGTRNMVDILDTAGLGVMPDQSTPLSVSVALDNGFGKFDQDGFGTGSVVQTVGVKGKFVAAFPGQGGSVHF
jgi:hypothetical protein